MPDVGIYFKLQAVKTSPAKTVDFPIYQSSTRAQYNYVKLMRSGEHEVQFVVSKEDAATLMAKKFEGDLEAHIFDNSRVADGGTAVDIRLYPLIPWRAEFIAKTVAMVTFKFAVGGNTIQDWADDVWDASGYVELSEVMESPAMTVGADRIQEYTFTGRVEVDPFNDEWARTDLHSSVTPTVKNAVSVGLHCFRRPATRWQNLRVWEAICGAVYWWDTEDRTIHLVLSDEDQPDLATYKDPKYLIEDFPNLENKWPPLGVYKDNFFFRRSFVDSSFSPYPIMNINPNLGLTVPTLYSPAEIGIRQNHYSSLVLQPLYIDQLSGGGLLATQQVVDDYTSTFERAVKATERTYRAYHRASRRTDWYRLKGFHEVSLGAEIASVTYKNQSTLVDFRDQRRPVWPTLPFLATPTISFVAATIQVKYPVGVGKLTYLGTANQPHSGAWAPAKALGGTAPFTNMPIELEDTLGLFPWLDVGDRVLAAWDGSRAVILQSELAADVELQ